MLGLGIAEIGLSHLRVIRNIATLHLRTTPVRTPVSYTSEPFRSL